MDDIKNTYSEKTRENILRKKKPLKIWQCPLNDLTSKETLKATKKQKNVLKKKLSRQEKESRKRKNLLSGQKKTTEIL